MCGCQIEPVTLSQGLGKFQLAEQQPPLFKSCQERGVPGGSFYKESVPEIQLV